MATSICTQASTLTSTILTSVSASVINTVAAARSSSEAVEAAAVAAAEEAINANATHSVRNYNQVITYHKFPKALDRLLVICLVP